VSASEMLSKLAAAIVAFDDVLAVKLAREALDQGLDRWRFSRVVWQRECRR